jgi:hypothetical protein
MSRLLDVLDMNLHGGSSDEPNPPLWPSDGSVFIVDGDRVGSKEEWDAIRHELQSAMQDGVHKHHDCNDVFFTQEHHFSSRRVAVLFMPGEYPNLGLQVGYYVQVLGLGKHPYDTRFIVHNDENDPLDSSEPSGETRLPIYCPSLNKHEHAQSIGSSLDTFWRSIENFSVVSTKDPGSAHESVTNDGGRDPAGRTLLLWAVSQAATMRNVIVDGGNLVLHDGAAFASGGHCSNVAVLGDGKINAGGQQQFLYRNVAIGTGSKHGSMQSSFGPCAQPNISGGAWSTVLVGCSGITTSLPQLLSKNETGPNGVRSGGNDAVVTEQVVPSVRMEKPYISAGPFDEYGQRRYELRVPQAIRKLPDSTNVAKMIGPSWEAHDVSTDVDVRDFSRVRVVYVGWGNVTNTIQQALDQGKDVILCPGIYFLESSIAPTTSNQVILGLGLATLVAPRSGEPCIRVRDGLPGVRIAGIMLEAAPDTHTDSLFVWGTRDGKDAGDESNPGGLFDVFCRVGGPIYNSSSHHDISNKAATAAHYRKNIRVNTMMEIHSGNIVADHLWLWRADHSALFKAAPASSARPLIHEEPNYPHISARYWQSEQDEFCVQTGLEVTGSNVTIYGLAVEHALGDQVLWSGDKGSVYFFQCELPYDVDDRFAKQGYSGYHITENVKSHTLYAPGIYSNFRNSEVWVSCGIRYDGQECDPDRAINILNPFTVKLDNFGGILSVVNGVGPPTIQQGAPSRLPPN